MMEKIKQAIKNFFDALAGKKQLTLQESVKPSDENEFCQNKNNQREPIQLPSRE